MESLGIAETKQGGKLHTEKFSYSVLMSNKGKLRRSLLLSFEYLSIKFISGGSQKHKHGTVLSSFHHL